MIQGHLYLALIFGTRRHKIRVLFVCKCVYMKEGIGENQILTIWESLRAAVVTSLPCEKGLPVLDLHIVEP